MDSIRSLNEALEYIDQHLAEDIDLEKAARLAYCSEYHFKRMFTFLAGITLSEYIRRRRLSQAALELRNNDVKVIDIALKYGYTSPDSFTRAFRELHGVTPSEARKDSHSLKIYPKMIFQLTIRGGNEMNCRVVEKEPFRIVGLMKRVPIQFNGANPEITAMWGLLNPEMIQQLKSLSNIEPFGLLQASTNFSEGRMEEKGELDHYIGVVTSQSCPESQNYATLEVPASTWAVFESVGPFPETLQAVWGRIYSEWFPSTDYQLAPGPEIMWTENFNFDSPGFKSQLWIPVRK